MNYLDTISSQQHSTFGVTLYFYPTHAGQFNDLYRKYGANLGFGKKIVDCGNFDC